jgi:integrase
MTEKKKRSRNFAPKMADINEIAVTYRQHLARLPKHNTRTDYTKRLAMLERWCSMHGITCVEEIDFLQFLDWVFYERCVSPRTRNNYRNWCRSFCSWLRLTPNPMDDIKPMKEPGKIRQPLPAAMLRRIKEHLVLHDKHFLLAVMLEYYTFIRPGELAELKVGDIDVKRHAIHVRASISKNGKAEMVGLNTAIVSLMRELGTLRAPKDWYIFSSRLRPGTVKLDSRAFRDRWARLRKRLAIPKEYQFYSLKDSGIRDLANNAGIVIARDQARHSSIAVTNKYLQGRDRPIHQATVKFKGAL